MGSYSYSKPYEFDTSGPLGKSPGRLSNFEHYPVEIKTFSPPIFNKTWKLILL